MDIQKTLIDSHEDCLLCFLPPGIPTTGINTVLYTLNRAYSCNQPKLGGLRS
jgi:hypothetical protein